VETLKETLSVDVNRFFAEPIERDTGDTTYDEFCLVANFIVDPLQSVDLISVAELSAIPDEVLARLQQRKRKRKPAPVNASIQSEDAASS